MGDVRRLRCDVLFAWGGRRVRSMSGSVEKVWLVQKAECSDLSTDVQAGELGSITDLVKVTALDGIEASQSHGCSVDPHEHAMLQDRVDKVSTREAFRGKPRRYEPRISNCLI